MLKSIYTNTGKASSVIGLLALTIGMKYVEGHADEIVDGLKNTISDAVDHVNHLIHHNQEPVYPVYIDNDGQWKYSKKPIWVNRQ